MRTSAIRERLVVTRGHLRGQVIEVAGRERELVLGRDPDCDVVLDTPYVSRMHLRLRHDRFGTSVTDLRTMGGTAVNGVRIRGTTVLHDGDEVELGGITLRYEVAPV